MCATDSPDRSHRYWTTAVVLTVPVVGFGVTLWPTATMVDRLVRDAILYGFVSVALVLSYDRGVFRDLGWVIDRDAIRAAILLTIFVLPFYIVGSSLPAVRATYPVWETSLAVSSFLPHVLGILAITTAVETYYRGLLCIGVRHLGFGCILVHLPLYVYVHLSAPTIEVVLSAFVGLLFGAVAYKTGSIFPTVLAHSVGFIVLDFLVLSPPLFSEFARFPLGFI